MSAVSSQLFFPSSPPWHFNARVLNVMDSIYAIAFGLGLRTLVDAVSQDFRLTGSLIGLWEGVITLHFLKKMPKSSDPYIAFGVRLFVDFLVTESVGRLVLVLIWTAFGMVLADVAPAIWDEVGLKRVWRHFRRDLYTIYEKIPKVAFFPPPRTVRFSPSREPSIISPSIATFQDTPIAVIPPSSSAPSEPLKRRVPGYYPGDYSDTDTDRGSFIRSRLSPQTEVNDALGTTHYRLSTMPRLNHTYSVSDLDEANQSSAASSSDSTETGDPSSFNQEDIPDIEGEEQALVDIKEADPTTPKQKKLMYVPPTPSDSAARWDIQRDIVDDGRPRPEVLSDIPDSVEDGPTSDGWEKIQRGELDEDKPPTPPAKDGPVGGDPISISIPLPVPPMVMRMDANTGSTSTNPMEFSLLDAFSDPPVPTSTAAGLRRESVPPPYADHDEYDGIYYNPPHSRDNRLTTMTTTTDDVNINENVKNNNDDNNVTKLSSGQTGDFNSTAYWASEESGPLDATAQAQADALKEEAVKKQAEEDARLTAERVRKEEEERVRKEEEERVRREEEERVRKEEEEKVRKEEEERVRREEEERVRKEEEEKVRQEEEERVRQEEEERVQQEEERVREADKKKKAEEKAERQKKEAEDAALRKKRQEEAAAEENKRKEDAAKKKKEEEAAKKEKEEAAKKKKEEEVATKKKEEEEAKRRKEEEEAAKKKKEEEAERKRMNDEAEKKRRDEEEVKQKEKEAEEAALSQAEAEAQEILKTEAKEAGRISAETEAQRAELDKLKGEAVGDQATQEDEDDSKTVHNVDLNQNTETQQDQQGPSTPADAPDTTPHRDFTEEESTVSEASAAPPQQAKERLERMMTLRAQMVELEKLLDQRKEEGFDEQDPEVRKVEKALRKYRRQAERRHAAGVPLAQHLDGPHDNDDGISLEGVLPQIAGIKIEEKLERLLTPTSRSITFNLTTTQKGKDAKIQRPVVQGIMKTYNLYNYTNQINKREYTITIPEEYFADWLTDYRALVAKRDSEEGDDDNPWELA